MVNSISKVIILGFILSFLLNVHPTRADQVKPPDFCEDGGAGGYPFSKSFSTPGAGKFIFKDEMANPERPLDVWYYLPENLPRNHQIIFVMHGGSRNGSGYRYPWIEYAVEFKFLLIAPEFAREYYPDNYHYNYGNVATRAKEPIDELFWTFSTIEHLFDYLKAHLNFARNTYSIYGHSAGAQFVHRMVLLKSNARIDRAVAGNAGWYTLPVFEKNFPEGLKMTIVTAADRKHFFSTKLFVLLGDHDNDPDSPGLPWSDMAKAQGRHRFERGHTFFKIAEKEALKHNIPFAWQLRIAKGAGHSHLEMAEHVLPLIIETTAAGN